MKKVYLALFVIFIPLTALNQTTAEQMKTKDVFGVQHWNGRFWEQLDDAKKLMFLAGLDEGQAVFFYYYITRLKSEDEIASFRTYSKMFATEGATLTDIKQQIDLFYEDRANIRIPIGDAHVYTSYRIRGGNPKELEEVVAKMRALYNKE